MKPIDFYPEEVRDILHLDTWEYENIKKIISKLNTKKKVRFDCEMCGNSETIRINEIKKRKICGTRPLCKKCAIIFATNSKEWRKSNSEAQFVAQNRPDVKEKQRVAQKRLMIEDPLYLEKRRSKSFISGKINDIYFDSSWELFFIIWCFENENIQYIKRFEEFIEYTDRNGNIRKYKPNFFVEYKNGDTKVFEIKGERSRNVKEKKKAAEEKYGNKYVFLDKEKLYEIGILVRSAPYVREKMDKAKKYDLYFDENETYKRFKDRLENGDPKWLL